MVDVLRLPAGRKPPLTTAVLLDLLEEGGGSVQVADPPDEVRAAWRRLLHAVKQGGEVPTGWYLLHRGRNRGDLTIELRPGEHPSGRYRRPAEPSSIPVPVELGAAHPAVDRLRDEPHRLPASTANRSRALMIVQALADAAVAKGHAVVSGEQDVLIVVEVDGQRYGVRIAEEAGTRWTLRLALEIDGAGKGISRWVDYAHPRVEDDLAEGLAEIERRATAVRAEQRAQQCAERQRLEDKRLRQVIKRRDKVLREQVAAWKLAQQIRAHCDQLVAAGMPADDPWVMWASAFAAGIDPLGHPPAAPPDPSPTEKAQELSPAPVMPSPFPRPQPWHPNRRWYHG
jgi:hypothetical protein